MTTSHFRLSHALLPQGWQSGVNVSVDAGGIIQTVAANVTQDGAIAISGYTVPAVPNVH